MQINFEPEQIRAAHAYVDRLRPKKIAKKEKLLIKKSDNLIAKDFDMLIKEEKSSFIKRIVNFLFR
jgi:hypothetical protein